MGGNTASTEALDAFERYMAARSMAVTTLKRRRSSLGGFAHFLAPMSILEANGLDIEEWIGTLRAPRTRHAYRSDLSAFYAWAVRRKLVAANPVADTDSIRVPKGLPRPAPIASVPAIVRAAPEPLSLGLALAAYAGLRRSEVVRVTSDDIQFAPEALLIVRQGTGAKDRILPLHPELLAMLAERRPQGRLVPWTADRFGRRAAAHMRSLGFDCTAHSLRHSFGTEGARVLDGNMVALARLLGHENVSTSQVYNAWTGGETAVKMRQLFRVA